MCTTWFCGHRFHFNVFVMLQCLLHLSQPSVLNIVFQPMNSSFREIKAKVTMASVTVVTAYQLQASIN